MQRNVYAGYDKCLIIYFLLFLVAPLSIEIIVYPKSTSESRVSILYEHVLEVVSLCSRIALLR